MSKSFISILGTNDYLECLHKFPDGEVSTDPVKYVQEDLINNICKDWTEDDEIRIYLTEEAKKRNWFDNGHSGREGKAITNLGLKSRIDSLQLKAKVLSYSIKEGFNEAEIWEIFQSIYDSFKENEEVIVDITHSFRSLPMLLITLLNFAKQVKKIRVLGIYYAAFENLGPIQKVKEIPVAQRIAPVLDLTSFSNLQEWTNATYDFINNANINLMKSLVKHSSKQSTVKDPIVKYFPTRVLDRIEKLINNIALCRGKELIKFNFTELKNDLNELKNKEINQTFKILIDEISNKISNFNNDYQILVINLSEWCLQHRLFQQTITLLQEFSISLVLNDLNLQTSYKSNRNLVSQAFRIKSQKIKEEEWNEPAFSNKDLIKEIFNLFYFDKLTSSFNKLTDIRNDVNHSGFLDDAGSVESIKTNLENILQAYKQVLGSHYANQSLQSSK